MDNIKNKLKSIRVKLFLTLCIVVIIIIAFLIITNNFILETFYLYSKQRKLVSVYETLNNYYTNQDLNINLELELEKIAINNNFDIVVKTDKNVSIYSINRDFLSTINSINSITNMVAKNENIILRNDKVTIQKIEDSKNRFNIYSMSCYIR
ncbi:MAG: hypothetical protein HFJ53_01790 [Clostridia bacterium]|nr:hypothetical protein [Clostridia bacterium]